MLMVLFLSALTELWMLRDERWGLARDVRHPDLDPEYPGSALVKPSGKPCCRRVGSLSPDPGGMAGASSRVCAELLADPTAATAK